ncbi:hypothetical protein D9M68_793550 [compost metagenome]
MEEPDQFAAIQRTLTRSFFRNLLHLHQRSSTDDFALNAEIEELAYDRLQAVSRDRGSVRLVIQEGQYLFAPHILDLHPSK